MSETQGKLLLDRIETAKLLSISAVTLYRLMRSGKISFIRIGDKPLFTRTDIEEFINAQRQARRGR